MRQILLQNATATLLQKAPGFLLQNTTVSFQNATVITKCDFYCKFCDSTHCLISEIWLNSKYLKIFVPVVCGAIDRWYLHAECNRKD